MKDVIVNTYKTLLAGLILAVSTAAANAATYYADNVVSVKPGICAASASNCAANNRKNVMNAVDMDDSTFYAMGLGGEITVSFALPLFTEAQKVSAFEITFNRVIGHDEAAAVYSVLAGVPTFLGNITNFTGEDTLLAAKDFDSIKLVDISKTLFPKTTSFDGFDLSALKVSVAPVPLPAAGALLLAGLGGLAALRRRKNAA